MRKFITLTKKDLLNINVIFAGEVSNEPLEITIPVDKIHDLRAYKTSCNEFSIKEQENIQVEYVRYVMRVEGFESPFYLKKESYKSIRIFLESL